MRAVTACLFHSLDGVVESPNLWQFDSFDDELGAAMGTALAQTDTVLLGRVGYQEWAEYWPSNPDDAFGAFINPVPKFVASRSLSGPLAWTNSTLIDGDLVDFVRDLKNQEGGDIAINASISLVRQLLFAGELDRLTLITHPVVAGQGRKLFDPADDTTRLELLDSSSTSAGNIVATYGLKP